MTNTVIMSSKRQSSLALELLSTCHAGLSALVEKPPRKSVWHNNKAPTPSAKKASVRKKDRGQ